MTTNISIRTEKNVILAIAQPYSELSISHGEVDSNECSTQVYSTKEVRVSRDLSHLIGEIDIQSIGYIAANVGPGSFSSLRTTLSGVNGLALALDVPVIPCTTFDVLYASTYDSFQKEILSGAYVCVILNAYNGEVFYAIRDKDGHDIIPEGYARWDEFLETLSGLKCPGFVFAGNSALDKREELQALFKGASFNEKSEPDGSFYVDYARHAIAQGDTLLDQLEARYLKIPNYKKV